MKGQRAARLGCAEEGRAWRRRALQRAPYGRHLSSLAHDTPLTERRTGATKRPAMLQTIKAVVAL